MTVLSGKTVPTEEGGAGGGGSGTVTNFSAVVPAELTKTVTNPTTIPELTISWNAASGNKVIASPADGSSGAYAGRALVSADIPSLTSTYQPLDADLTAIAALSTTSYGRGFLTAADAAAGRTYLGLGSLATQSGTFSGTSSGTNTGDQTITLTGDVTGSGTGSFAATIGSGKVTEAMQVLADNTTQNVSTSKHGYVVKLPNDATKYFDGSGAWSVPAGGGSSYAGTIVTLTDGATIAINANDWGIAGIARVTVAADGHTFGAPSNPHDGQTLRLEILTAAVRTILWNAAFSGDIVPLPASTTGGGLVDELLFAYRSTEAKWYLIGSTLAVADTGATTALDNLTTTSIPVSLNSDTDDTDDLGVGTGATPKRWQNVYASRICGSFMDDFSNKPLAQSYSIVDNNGGSGAGRMAHVQTKYKGSGSNVYQWATRNLGLTLAWQFQEVASPGPAYDWGAASQMILDSTGGLKLAGFGGSYAAIGDANPKCRFGGNHQVNSTPVASSNSGSEQDLQSITLAAGLLATAKDVLSFEMVFTFAANATTKQIKAYLGSTAVFDSGALAFNGGSATLYGTIVRTGATSQRVSVTFAGNTTLLAATSQYTDVTETLANALALKGTVTLGLGAAANDAIQKFTVARYEPVGA